MQWETVIGLEVHLQLATRSKIFSGSPTTFGAAPNTQASAVDLAMPGMLPVLNAEAVRFAVMFGLGIGAEIGRPRGARRVALQRREARLRQHLQVHRQGHGREPATPAAAARRPRG